jgi:capsular polysaccharide biosynthesis protein
MKTNPELHTDYEVTLFGEYALGLSPDKSYIPSTYLWREDVLVQTLTAGSPVCGKPVMEWAGGTVSLLNIWSHNYFHWLLENLTQLTSIPYTDIDRVVIQSNAPAYIHDSLTWLGLGSKMIEWQGGPVLCHKLVSFGPVRVEGRTDSQALRKLRAAFGLPAQAGLELDTGAPSRIYISRAKAGSRRVGNEGELADLLKQHEIMLVSLEGKSLPFQIQLFSHAKRILAPHGAGLTNMVWASPGCTVIELSGSYTNPCYFWLSQALGHEHVNVHCAPSGMDMIANLETLKGYLQ